MHRYISEDVKGVRYNVIRRPLSGGKGTIKQKQGSKNIAPETKEEYWKRVGSYLKANPKEYFMRWKVEVALSDLQMFKYQFLNPVLENLADDHEWWEHCQKSPDFSVYGYVTRAVVFPHHRQRHWRLPYGVYNPIAEGGSTDLDEYLATSSLVGLERTDTLFPELEC